jgi:hypothetical protein
MLIRIILHLSRIRKIPGFVARRTVLRSGSGSGKGKYDPDSHRPMKEPT